MIDSPRNIWPISDPGSMEMISLLGSLQLPSDDYAVFGSGPMFAAGIKPLGHDLDIIARGKALARAESLIKDPSQIYGGKLKLTEKGDKYIAFFHSKIEVWYNWGPGEWDIDKLINEADKINGIRWVNLETVLNWKKSLSREKDLEHIKMLEDYLASHR